MLACGDVRDTALQRVVVKLYKLSKIKPTIGAPTRRRDMGGLVEITK